ncbi:MAG: histidine phosphatase family protein [Bacillota bacterium]|nr:MAG: histidine phosphatase family protein [Bacillota bacterium]
MVTLYLIRHGQTDWNRERRWQAQLDVPLNDHGRGQALELGTWISRLPLGTLYSSDLGRALETARIVAECFPKGLSVSPDHRWREFDAGALAGYTIAELRELYPDWWEADQRDPVGTTAPGGESFRDMVARVTQAATELAEKHPAQTVGVVTHGGPVRALVSHVLGLTGQHLDSLYIDNCGLTVVEWGPNPRLLALNVSRRWLG